MKWIDRTNTFEKRTYLDKYLEICEVLDDKIEVNLYSCPDINKYEIYVNYFSLYGIVYVSKDNSLKLREEIKDLIYNDYIKNGKTSDEFIKEFIDKYKIDIPNDIFFDEDAFMNSMLEFFDNLNNFDDDLW